MPQRRPSALARQACSPGTRTLVALASFLIGAMISAGPYLAAEKPIYRGRPLPEVLQRLQERGLNLIFSSAVVREDLVVTVEPEATEPRAILDEILAPLGLEARDGPGGSVLIVGSGREAATGVLRGRVLSSTGGRPIAGAQVTLTPSHARTTTRRDGTFELERIPGGMYDVQISAAGFRMEDVPDVRISPDAVRDLTVELETRPTLVEEIVVTPSRLSLVQQEQAARLTVGNEDAVLVPTVGGDVNRIVALLPGVSAPDNSAAFNIRGSLAGDVSLVLDGLELYEPFHLQAFQSPFSFIDSKIVDQIDFFGGGMTAEFGDRHGGVVRMTTRSPEANQYRTRIELGSVNSRFTYGGSSSSPLGPWLISARAWYPEAIRDSIELGDAGLAPHFGDAYVKLSVLSSPRTVLTAHGLFAFDRLEFNEADGNEKVHASNESGHVWLRALSHWREDLTSETVLSGGRIERLREGLSEPEDDIVVVRDERRVNFFGLKHDATWRISESHLLKVGAEVRKLDARYSYATGPVGDVSSKELDPDGSSFALHVAHRGRITPALATEIGIRWDKQSYADDEQLSPRANAVWQIGERTTVRAALGQVHQSQRIHELRVEDGETRFLPAERSSQVLVTFQHRYPVGVRFRLDAYYRKLSQLRPRYENVFNPLELFPETEEDRMPVAPSRARLRGVEFLVRSDPRRPFAWWASYALSKAQDVIDGRAVPRSWDQTHSAKFLLGYRRNETWWVSLIGVAHTGWPITPVTGRLVTLPDGSSVVEPVQGDRNSDRFSTYARLDLKASRAFSVPRGRLRLDFEIVNLTDRKNACCIDEFVFEPQPDGTVRTSREVGHWLGITPSFSLLWEF